MGHTKCKKNCHHKKHHKNHSSSSSSSTKDSHKPEPKPVVVPVYNYVLKQSLANHNLTAYQSIVNNEGSPLDLEHIRYKLNKHHWEKIWSHVLESVFANGVACDGKPVKVTISNINIVKGSKSNNLNGLYYLDSWELSFQCASGNISVHPQFTNTLLKDFFVNTNTVIQGVPLPKKKVTNNWQGTLGISEVLPDEKWPSLDKQYPRTKQKVILYALHFLYILLKTSEYNGSVTLIHEDKSSSHSHSSKSSHKDSSESSHKHSSKSSDKHSSSSGGSFVYPHEDKSSSSVHHKHPHKHHPTCGFCGH